uniref:Uncharacterized protein n=1 Tax=Anguilla anguilla TaxID=7936 RepID=A0A0E9UAD2_ANGAN
MIYDQHFHFKKFSDPMLMNDKGSSEFEMSFKVN